MNIFVSSMLASGHFAVLIILIICGISLVSSSATSETLQKLKDGSVTHPKDIGDAKIKEVKEETEKRKNFAIVFYTCIQAKNEQEPFDTTNLSKKYLESPRMSDDAAELKNTLLSMPQPILVEKLIALGKNLETELSESISLYEIMKQKAKESIGESIGRVLVSHVYSYTIDNLNDHKKKVGKKLAKLEKIKN
ncbi:hypothetical protein DdX_18943 [Ditylenchus destructor]|uniref:Uncharacterized protein n=1 Tax=Ditylenchus destructor TaxID=166010 RepID=A0AAD4QXL8_9BILA|nr:hypothetical protein DdX_18943 [Ditylenchus destructor]